MFSLQVSFLYYACVAARAKQPYVVAVPNVKFLCSCFVSVRSALLKL